MADKGVVEGIGTRLSAFAAGSMEKIVVPTILKQEVLCECHDLPAVGHMGICQTMELVDR